MVNLEVGILNTHNGKNVRQIFLKQEMFEDGEEFFKRTITIVKRVAKWFDGKTTFCSAPVFDHLDKVTGISDKVKSIALGTSFNDVTAESLAVDIKGERLPVVHEIYVKRIKA